MATTRSLTRLGTYELVRPLGKGGMAAVYLARSGHGAFVREVALKVLEHDASPENTEMFLTEGRLLGMLQHPNIASVIDVDIDDGTLYLAMEHVDGVDLRELLVACFERKELPSYEVAIAIIAQAAAGLDHAHRRCDTKGRPLRLVHRDVSLTNIMVTHDGGVKVVDFGIARSTLSTTHTMPGTVRGKPSYMAPEQCTGDPVDHRTDVFALGIVLYELTTGIRCFEGESDFERMLAVVRGTFQLPSALQADFPSDLEQVIMKALARVPADRYASCAAMVAALEEILRARGWAGGANAIRRAMQVVFGAAREAAIAPTAQMPIAVTAPAACVHLSEPVPHRRFARGSRVELALDEDITAGRRSIKRITNVVSDDRAFQGSNS